jgi:hypothetical protein
MKAINIKVFIISFIFGILYVYFTNPPPKNIVVYPTDDNKSKFQFRDKINNCFQMKQNIIKCSNDFEEIPIQI